MNGDFLGRGWSFPPTFDRGRGGVDMVQDEDDIRQSLQILLSTALGERTMLPQFGCNLDELVFESLDRRMATLMTDKISTAILYFEPRIELLKVELDEGGGVEGLVMISVDYTIKSTNSRTNFVFPFYRLEGTDINLTATVNMLP